MTLNEKAKALVLNKDYFLVISTRVPAMAGVIEAVALDIVILKEDTEMGKDIVAIINLDYERFCA